MLVDYRNLDREMETKSHVKSEVRVISQKNCGNFKNIIKSLLLITLFFTLSTVMYAQDIIYLRNGDEIESLVQKVGNTEIEYKKKSNLQGPTYTVLKSDVFMIEYKNGEKEIFKKEETLEEQKQQTTNNQSANGYALLHLYRPKNFVGGGVWFDIDLNEEEVWRCKNDRKKTIKLTKEGTIYLHARTEKSATLAIDVEFGKEYYVECTVSMGAFVGRPHLTLKESSAGNSAFNMINKNDTE